jgi:hypothetical protein
MDQPNNSAARSDSPSVSTRRPAHRSRTRRWRDAVAELIAVQRECNSWLQVLPDGLQESATGQALEAICDLDLSDIEAIEPPRGFGRD